MILFWVYLWYTQEQLEQQNMSTEFNIFCVKFLLYFEGGNTINKIRLYGVDYYIHSINNFNTISEKIRIVLVENKKIILNAYSDLSYLDDIRKVMPFYDIVSHLAYTIGLTPLFRCKKIGTTDEYFISERDEDLDRIMRDNIRLIEKL